MLSGPAGQIPRAGTALVDTITLRALDRMRGQGLGSFFHVDAKCAGRYREDSSGTVTSACEHAPAYDGLRWMIALLRSGKTRWHYCCRCHSFGSSAVRRPSPRKLNASTLMTMA